MIASKRRGPVRGAGGLGPHAHSGHSPVSISGSITVFDNNGNNNGSCMYMHGYMEYYQHDHVASSIIG